MEKLEYQSPETYSNNGLIEIDRSHVDFVYVIRKDAEFAMIPLAYKFADYYGQDSDETLQAFIDAYGNFESKFGAIMSDSFSVKGAVRVDAFDPNFLEQMVKQKAEGLPIVSLDPLLIEGVDSFPVSRAYALGGIEEIGHTTRPGYLGTMEENALALAQKYIGQEVVVIEDDIFSGTSLVNALDILIAAGVKIARIIPGIQIGESSLALVQTGIPIDPVIKYVAHEGDIFDKLDLGDPRDFLVGASGLVIMLPNGELGRMPYVLPFVSPTARASIPKEAEQEFSIQMLEANLRFYQEIESQCGYPPLLRHMDPAFVKAVSAVCGFDEKIPMTDFILWSIKELKSW